MIGAIAARSKIFASDRRGNVVITTALLLPLVVSAVGAAVSYSVASGQRNKMQAAIDSAVLAGAGLETSDARERIALAERFFTANLRTPANPLTSAISANFTVQDDVVRGTAEGLVDNVFGVLIGSSKMTVKVNAAARRGSIDLCILGLNTSENGALDMNGNARLNAPACAVQANSRGRDAVTQEGKPTAVTKRIGVVGGHKGDNFTPPPVDGAPSIPDPFASIPFPQYTDCSRGGGGTKIKDDATLSPGTFCGGIHVFGNSTKVRLQPGVYVMVDGPFWIDASSTVTGDDVVIAFTGKGAALQVWGNSTLQVTSPRSGPYMNMQFMQDRNSDSTRGLWNSIGGNARVDYDGLAYFPSQNFWVFGDAVLNANSPATAIAADKIWFQGNVSVSVTTNNPRGLPVVSPKVQAGAVLIK